MVVVVVVRSITRLEQLGELARGRGKFGRVRREPSAREGREGGAGEPLRGREGERLP